MTAASFKLLIFVVAYNAEKYIKDVLDRIPAALWENTLYQTDILIIDDASKDATYDICTRYAHSSGKSPIVRRNAVNLGYGGNQKLGYRFAVDNHYSAVVLLHGDGQYDPALIPQLAEPVQKGEADMVIGSRMMHKQDALKGGMPLYKFIGNIVLTFIQNRILGCQLAEFHSGYRIYATSALRQIPFEKNSDYFDFDTDILIQCIDTKQRIREIAVPTFYGDEISHVNGIKYALRILWFSLVSRLQKHGLVDLPKFRYGHM